MSRVHPIWPSTLLLGILTALAACAPPERAAPLWPERTEGDPPAEEAEAPEGIIEDDLRLREEGESGRAWLPGDSGPFALSYRVLEGRAVAQGDILLGTPEEVVQHNRDLLARVGRESRSYRWPYRVVPYTIDPALPDPERVHDAIAHWEDNTDFVFVPRTAQPDYVRFIETTSTKWDCSSKLGRMGGLQDIEVNSGAWPDELVAVAINKGTGQVWAWSDDGTVTAGTPTDLDDVQNGEHYTLPSGYDYADIRAIAMDDGVTTTYFANGLLWQGVPDELGYLGAPMPYSLPVGKTPADLRGADELDDGRVVSWYDDGTYAIGTTADLDTYSSGHPWHPAPGRDHDDVVGFAIAPGTDLAYLWYGGSDAEDWVVSRGSWAALPASQIVEPYVPRATCSTGSLIHEIGHAVGLFHELSRSDRDQFVTILWGNIKPDCIGNFDKISGSSGRDLGVYDYGSIMHYGDHACAFLPEFPTLITTDPAWQDQIGQRSGLSDGDLRGIKELYGYSPALRSLTEAYDPSDIAGIGIAGSTSRVYTWHDDGYVSQGRNYDLDDYRTRQSYTLAPGRQPADIVAMAIAKSTDHCYAWYDDGTVSSGTSRDLDKYRAPYTYSLPPGYDVDDIVGIAISPPSDRVVTLYRDNRYSIGTSADLDRYKAPAPFAPPAGLSATDIVDVDFITGGHLYVWYHTFDFTIGSVVDLDLAQKAW